MTLRSWIPQLFARPVTRPVRKAPARCRPAVEALEDRLVPAAPLVGTGGAVLDSSGTQATLYGAVNPQGLTATARFQYSYDSDFFPTETTTLGSGFSTPTGVAVDGAGNVFVADTGHDAVKKILPNGTILTLGSFSRPSGVAVDAAGNVFVADLGHNAVKEILR